MKDFSITKSKTGFRVMRETIGYTQKDVSRMFGVSLRSVKRWESEEMTAYRLHDNVWDGMVNKYNEFIDECEKVYLSAKNWLESLGEDTTRPLVIAYYKSQEQLDLHRAKHPSVTKQTAPVGWVNATTRDVVGRLVREGRQCFLVDPDTMEFVERHELDEFSE